MRPLVLSLLRKGGVDIPVMFLLDELIGINGVAISTVVAEAVGVIVAINMLIKFLKKNKA